MVRMVARQTSALQFTHQCSRSMGHRGLDVALRRAAEHTGLAVQFASTTLIFARSGH